MDTIITFSVNITFIILSLILYYILTNKYPISNFKKILIAIDVVFLIVNMLVLSGLFFLAIYAHYFIG